MWRNWQTRTVQVRVGETPWRFESSHPHSLLGCKPSPAMSADSGKRPELAILLSCLVPGLGEVYLGRRQQGAALVVVFLALAIPVWVNAVPYLILVWPTL